MPRADFYLIDKPRFRAEPLLLVCELAKKAFAGEQPTLVLVRSPSQAEALDELMWAFDEAAFIPHQIAGDEDDAVTAVLIVPPGVATPPRQRRWTTSCGRSMQRNTCRTRSRGWTKATTTLRS